MFSKWISKQWRRIAALFSLGLDFLLILLTSGFFREMGICLFFLILFICFLYTKIKNPTLPERFNI